MGIQETLTYALYSNPLSSSALNIAKTAVTGVSVDRTTSLRILILSLYYLFQTHTRRTDVLTYLIIARNLLSNLNPFSVFKHLVDVDTRLIFFS